MSSLTSPTAGSVIETVVVPPTRSLGDGFNVRRALPSIERRMVGPFVFFDQMGPTVLRDGRGLDVRPHPHIGLATVTYLLQGELMHRDSLGTVQSIVPGDVNWMVAGNGIVHSERSPEEARHQGAALFGLQAWVALPERKADMPPGFAHVGAADLPVVEGEGKQVRIIAGELFGKCSPVVTESPMFYADATLDADAQLAVPADHEERAFYLLDGAVEVSGEAQTFQPGQLVVLRPGAAVTLTNRAAQPARLMLLGGAPLGPRMVWWNFVASSRERIEQAKDDWKAGRFAAVPGETERIPLPEKPMTDSPLPVHYP